MLLLVGLGNPGARYAYNRHNIGWLALDDIVERYRFSPWRSKFQGQICEGTLDGVKTLALKPTTFMNRSGQSVAATLNFYKLAPEQTVVLHDDLDLAPGKVRVKKGGGHGGHNGLRSLDQHIGKEYWRVRLGIGHPGHKDRVEGYVLSDFAKAEEAWLDPLMEAVADAAPMLAQGHPDKFMTRVALLTRQPDPGAEPA